MEGGIALGLAFDSKVRARRRVARDVDFIFGGYFADWNFGFYPRVKDNNAYLPFELDPYPQSVPGHSLADWQATHPDWIVYRCDGKTPAYYGHGNTNVPLDFTNPAARAWQLRQAAPMLRRGATGIAFDDVAFTNFEGRCGVYKHGSWTPLGYPGAAQPNAKLNADMLAWLKDMRAALKRRFPTKTLAVNLSPSVSGLAAVKAATPYIDADFDEAGFTDYGERNLSGAAWLNEVRALELLERHGKAVDINGIVHARRDAAVTHSQIDWVLANYLLVRGARTYTYIYAGNDAGYTGSPSGYGAFYDRPEYHIPIGWPTSGRHQSQGVQMRSYSGGLALVNPSGSETHTLHLERPYRDMYGHVRTTITLRPATAMVLLRTGTRR